MLIESLLLMIVQVPPLNACLVQRVLLELCSRDASLYTPVLTMGCNALFNLMPAMDVCAIRELSNLMSVYLSNKNRVWPYWTYWGDEYAEIVKAGENDNAQKLFLEILLGSLTRKSGFESRPGDRMRTALPRSLHSAITADESLYRPDCKLYEIDNATKTRSPLAQAILERLQQRIPPEDLAGWLSGPLQEYSEGVDDGFRITYLLQGLLVFVCDNDDSQGGTLSAVRNAIERYRMPLVNVVAINEEGGHILTEGIVACLAWTTCFTEHIHGYCDAVWYYAPLRSRELDLPRYEANQKAAIPLFKHIIFRMLQLIIGCGHMSKQL